VLHQLKIYELSEKINLVDWQIVDDALNALLNIPETTRNFLMRQMDYTRVLMETFLMLDSLSMETLHLFIGLLDMID
jgi:hypothetical protein